MPFFLCYANNYTAPLIAMSIFSFLSHFLLSITVVSSSAVYALSCCRDNFWRLLAGFLAEVYGLFIAETLISFEIQSPFPWGICWVIAAYHCHNSLQKDSERQPCFLFSILHLFLSSILGIKRTKKNFFSFSNKGKGYALALSVCRNSHCLVDGVLQKRGDRLCRKLKP